MLTDFRTFARLSTEYMSPQASLVFEADGSGNFPRRPADKELPKLIAVLVDMSHSVGSVPLADLLVGDRCFKRLRLLTARLAHSLLLHAESQMPRWAFVIRQVTRASVVYDRRFQTSVRDGCVYCGR